MNQELKSLDENFIKSGGDSLKALLFVDNLEIEFNKLHLKFRNNFVLDFLLNQNVIDLINLIEQELNVGTNSKSVDLNEPISSKRIKLDDQILGETNPNCICWISKTNKFMVDQIEISINSKHLILENYWKVDTGKCVDATPLLLVTSDHEELVFIGSHSKKFICVNVKNGDLIWSFNTLNRIESSACVSKCAKFVIFGIK